MKANFLGLLGILLFAICLTEVAVAQNRTCAESIDVYTAPCANQFGCTGEYPLMSLNPCMFHGNSDCYAFVSTSMDCCYIGQNFWEYDPHGCGWTKLKDTKIESELALLSETEEILIPSCSGAYIPFSPAKREERRRA
jgi:hypothetical protein